MSDDYRQRIATALSTRIKQATLPQGPVMPWEVKVFGATEHDLADAVLAVRDDELRAVESVIEDLAAIVRDLADREPCEDFDHHGHCQTHGWLQDGVCPHARARDILTAQEAGESRG